jgi:O-antigen ligase
MGLVVSYFLLPTGRVKNGVKRGVMIAAPIVAIYAAVGWGRPEKIFAPLQSLASVSTKEDKSTKARNAENLGLIATVKQANAFTGTGWGHGYIELTNKYSIAGAMELWPYIPHNSVLGLLAYTGILGFAGVWLAFPTAVFLNARLAKLGGTVPLRNVGFVASSAMIVCGNQMYGDMGIFSLRTMYLLATTYAVALRMPMVAGTWVTPKARPVEPQPEPPPQQQPPQAA